jgi:KDO2-lipid IV(A) lauroyltransferase
MAQQAYAPLFVRRALEAAPALRRVVWWLEAAVLAVAWGLLALLPTDRASGLGRAVARRIGPRLRKHRHVLRNLAFVLPDRAAEQREAIAREVWGSLGAVFAELPHLARIARDCDRRVEVVIHGEIGALAVPPKPVVFVTGHLANWELTTLVAGRLGIPLSVVYSANSTPPVDWLIRRLRRALGCELVSKRGGVRTLLRALGRGRSLGLLIDTRQDDGEPVPFCGVPALTSTVPARLALHHGLDLVPVRVERLGEGARFRVTLGPPIAPEPSAGGAREQARRMTQRMNEALEAWIRERPEQWLCSKRRWPEDARPAGRSILSAGSAGRSA